MLSADVPEFIPKALRAQGQAANQNNAEEDDSSIQSSDALLTHPDVTSESPTPITNESSTSNAASDLNTEIQTPLCDSDRQAEQPLPCQTGIVETTLPLAEPIDQAESNALVPESNQDAGTSSGSEDLAAPPAAEAGAAAAGPTIAQDDGGLPAVASSLRATSAEFYPSSLYVGFNPPVDSPGPHMSYAGNPSPHSSPGFIYPGKPPFYYGPNSYGYYCDSNWAHDMDYGLGFYNPMVNAGHYSGGEYFVPDGGYMYDGGDGGYPHQPPQGAGLMMDPPFFDPSLAGDYSGGFVDVPGPGPLGRGGGAAGGASGGYNKKYANKNRQKRPPDQGGGRGGASGGGRQPSNEMRICGQTGELTVGKRRPQGSASQGKGSAPQDKVQASTIISNVKNWPTLNTGRVHKDESIISPTPPSVATATVNAPEQAAITTEVKPPVAESVQAPSTISFSFIAKKKSELNSSVAESAPVPSKKPNSGPSGAKAKKDSVMNKTSGDTQNFKGAQSSSISNACQASEVTSHFDEKSNGNESSSVKSNLEWTLKGKQPNYVAAVSSNATENSLPNTDVAQPSSTDNLTPLTKSAKKKARKKNKKQPVAATASTPDQLPLESKQISAGTSTENQKAENDGPPVAVNSVVPEKSKTVSMMSESQDQWPKKEVSVLAPKSSKNLEGSHSITETGKYKKSASENDNIKDVISKVQTNGSSPVNSIAKQSNLPGQNTVASNTPVEAKKPETVPEELTWVTVGKRSKNKKPFLAKEPEINLLPQSGKSFKDNSNRDKPSAPERSTKFPRTKMIAVEENSPKEVLLSSSASTIVKGVVCKTEASAPISSPEMNSLKESDKVEFSSETKVDLTSEPKKRDPNDPEVQKIMKLREIRKENIKREKKLNREAAALQKQAMAKKDSKLSVMPSISQRSADTGSTATESFAINSEEYPTLGAKKAPKSLLEKSTKNSKKEIVKKMNGIVQKSSEQVISTVAEVESKPELETSASSNVWSTGSKKVASTSFSAQPPIKIDKTTSAPSMPPAGEKTISVRPKVLSYSSAAASAATTVSSPNVRTAAVSVPRTVSGKTKKNVQPPARSKHVKSSDKLELDLRNLLAIKPSKMKSGKASGSISQAAATATVRRTPVARSARVLTTSVGKQPRIKGQNRKMPTAVQKYKKIYAQHKQELLLLLADLKRRQDAEQCTDINTEGFREGNGDCSQASSSELSKSTNNTSAPPDCSVGSSLLGSNSSVPKTASDSVEAEASVTADDAKSSKKKRKKKRGSGNKEGEPGSSEGNSSAALTADGAVAQKKVPEEGVSCTAASTKEPQGAEGAVSSGKPHTPLSPTEAKEIADRLTEELTRLQENSKIIKTNVITRDLNTHLITLLQSIVRFQRRSFFQDHIKAKAKRRYVSGIRETHHRLRKIQLLVVAQDAGRKIPVVTDSLAALIQDAEAQQVPVVFGLNRRRLAGLLCKESGFRVSCVGVINYQGAEESVKGVMSILPELRRQQQLFNNAQVVGATNSIVEEEQEEEEDEEGSSSSACGGNSGPFLAVATGSSSSSSSQSTPVKVAALAASAIGGRSGAQMLRGKNGIRQTPGASGKHSGGGSGRAGTTGGGASAGGVGLDINDKIVNILKEQKNRATDEKQTS